MTAIVAYRTSDRIPRTVAQTSAARDKEVDLVRLPARPRIEARCGQIGDIPLLLHSAETVMGVSLASADVVTRIACSHPDALWSFRRHGRLVGGASILMLNACGLAALLDDRFDLAEPPSSFIAPAGQRPAAIHIWAILGTAVAAEGIAHAIVRLQQYPYERADLFATPATDNGVRFTCGMGFRLVPGHSRALYRYVRLANRMHKSGEEVHECFSA
jgi:hypothetical protein